MLKKRSHRFWISLVLLVFVYTMAGCNDRNTENTFIIEEYIHTGASTLAVTTVASGLNVPWEIAWGSDDHIWMTEQNGIVSRINPYDGTKKILLTISDVWVKRSTGLLGLALHPDMKASPYVFLNYTFLKDSIPFSRLVRYTYSKDTLIHPVTLLEIPASTGHNGSRIAIAPDGKVMWATGDAAKDGNAQDTTALNGKILRLNIDGSIPSDNPITGSPVWARGFRNMQGLVYGTKNNLYASEHGDANDDEINLLRMNGNYGWPAIEGMADLPEEKLFHEKNNTTEPLKAWTPTIAPAGMDFYDHKAIPEWRNALLLTTLKDQSLRVLKLNTDGTEVLSEQLFLDKKYGRLRDICVSPKGDIYISTSNHDWNPAPGFPKEKDDRIIRIFKVKKQADLQAAFADATSKLPVKSKAATLYSQYCASCHKEDGKGIAAVFPALTGSDLVNGKKADLIKIVLNGIQQPGHQKTESMPAFNFLSDPELAMVLTYIRSSWNNKVSGVTPSEVTGVRNTINPQK